MTPPPPPGADLAFTPLRLGPLTLRNRFIKSATNEGMALGGMVSRALVKFHETLAAGGVGMTTLAYCAVSPDGRTFTDQVLMEPDSLAGLRILTDAVHAHGVAVSAQITHGGAFTFLPKLDSGSPLSASGGFNAAGALSGRLLRRAMSEADMERVAGEFVQAARLAREAGFDAVEIHMGHGYLLSQFLSPGYNRRHDAYGGSAEARARFPSSVLRQVLDAVGRDLAVVCKIGVVEGFKGGGTAEDAAAIARTLEREGAHLLVLSGGMNVEAPWALFGSPMPREAAEGAQNAVMRLASRLLKLREPKFEGFRELYFLDHARKVRAAVEMPLACLGGIESLDNVATAMGAGFEAVAMARALLIDPRLVERFRAGLASRSGCTRCNACVVSMYSPGGTHCVLRAPNDAALNALPAVPSMAT